MATALRGRLLLALALAVAAGPALPAAGQEEPPPATGAGDATVVAVIDSGFSPYHWDFLASKMPQAADQDPGNDLPLDQAPDTWLPGFPSPEAFTTYQRLDLTLEETNPGRSINGLSNADSDAWNTVETSSRDAVHLYWLPRTKVIGALTFADEGEINARSNSHGHGTSSVSVGNMFGTCPECLLVFIQFSGRESGEAAIDWAMSQPWIDAITNSYGFSLVNRDRLYSGSDTELQAKASERGQTIFFSAGNGQANTFTVPNTTIFSSQEGPDWIVTVGAVSPSTGASYSGHGKPADVSGVGSGYPSSYNAGGVGRQGSNFSGTSNSTPTVAGMYARTLYEARRALAGPSRAQQEGVVAVEEPNPELGETPFSCGAERPDCELGDGILTVAELRRRLFHGAVHTPAGTTVSGVGNVGPVGEEEFLNEGHGTYFARLRGTEDWLAELDRIVAPMEGRAGTMARPEGEREWMVVDSFCRQHLWGAWTGGYFVDGETELPGADPSAPLRSAIEATCPLLFPPV